MAVFILAFLPGCVENKELKQSLFVPEEFATPQFYDSGGFRFEPLTTAHAEMDYAAVMDSKKELRDQFGGDWPADDFTLEQNIADIREHERLHKERASFTYSILNEERDEILGCIYINPVDSIGFDAQVHVWTRRGQDDIKSSLRETLQTWLVTAWPFEKVVYW